jgi:hypothetical protein
MFDMSCVSDIMLICFMYWIEANCTLIEDFDFTGLDDRFGNEWRVLLVPQNAFMNMKFRGNSMGKLKNSFMFAGFFDELVDSVFLDNNFVGKKIWQEMNTQRQVKNLMYVCRLMTVAKYCKKEKVLEKDTNFITAMNAIYHWFQDKQYSELTGANCVKVTQNSLTVFDARGTSTRYTNYFLDRLHEIRNHSKG